MLVHVYAGTSAGVIGFLQGLPKFLNFTRACQYFNASLFVDIRRIGDDDIGRATRLCFEPGSAG